jgi:signal transduction histidine kinase/ActR/RegA family two-component response regulator
MRNLVDVLEVGVALLTTEGLILYSNPRFAQLLNFEHRREIESSRLKQLVSSASWTVLNQALKQAVFSRQEGELQIDSEQGLRTLRLILAPVDQPGLGAISATAIETTDLVAANNAVREREAALQSLTARIIEVQDQERRRIARDLHDVTGQELVGISLSLNAIARTTKALGLDLQQDFDECLGYVRKVENDIRTLSYILHPPLLDELGLASALSWYVEGFKTRSNVSVELDVPVRPLRLPIERETALFRVVQEGLTNVLRHSRSPKAIIRLFMHNNQIILSVEDEGAGIEPRKLEAANTARAEFGVGIPGMRERLKQFGGSLELRSSQSGTQLIARIPLLKDFTQPPSELASASVTDAVAAATPDTGKKRILIADDHEVTRRGICDIIGKQKDLEICGEARDGLEAVTKARELKPDLIILDLSMPKVGGLTAAQHIRELDPPTKILIFTNHAYAAMERLIRAAGCSGYVEKSNAGEDLLRGVRAILEGDCFFESRVVGSDPENLTGRGRAQARANGA